MGLFKKITELRCQAYIKTTLNYGDPEFVSDHCHPSNETEVNVIKFRRRVKERAQNTRENPMQIIGNCLAQVDGDTRGNIGNITSIRRDIQHQRKGKQPAEPTSLPELVIPDEWKFTTDNKTFLIHDSGVGIQQRLVIYATEDSLRVLAASDLWFMDGNFSMVPVIFKQLYIVRVPLGTSAVTTIYALLPGKTQGIYVEFFQAIVDACERLGFNVNPGNIICDLE